MLLGGDIYANDGPSRVSQRRIDSSVIDQEFAKITYDEMVDYLSEADIPAPPENVEWVLRLPPGLQPRQFWESLNGAVGEHQDWMAREQFSVDGLGLHPRSRMRAALHEKLDDLIP